MRCGSCLACLTRTNREINAVRPTGHYAPVFREGRIVDMLLIPAVLPDYSPPKPRKRGPSVKAQILELAGRGLLPEAIADALGVSDRRVRSALRDQQKQG